MISTFPEYRTLNLEDRAAYEALVSHFEPYSDICFSTLHIWWNFDKQTQLSSLLDNLVINYSQPYDRENSGWSVIGTSSSSEVVGTVLSHLQNTGNEPMLVHVPEITIKQLDSNAYDISEELGYNEYLLDVGSTIELEGSNYGRLRRKISRFERETDGKDKRVYLLDLSLLENQDKVFQAVLSWRDAAGNHNDPEDTEPIALRNTLELADQFNIQCLCLDIDGVLNAVVIYELTLDGKYYIVHHLKVDYTYPHIFEYMSYQLALVAKDNGVSYLNFEMDLDIESIRMFKQGLRPIGFFKKYTVRPKDEESSPGTSR